LVSDMKKWILFGLIAWCALAAQAGEYNYLVFTNTDGTTTAMTVTGLTLTVNGSVLQVTNGTDNVGFTLTDLASMQFSTADTLTAIPTVLNADKPVHMYTPTGVCLGLFPSLKQAAAVLNKGAYIVTDGSNSQKIILQ